MGKLIVFQMDPKTQTFHLYKFQTTLHLLTIVLPFFTLKIMVVASMGPTHNDCPRAVEVPVIDLSGHRPHVSSLMARACEGFGFFKVVNHRVPGTVIARMEAAGLEFFSLPGSEKQRAGPPNPLGYGSRSIGLKGDTGEVEYLLLHANTAGISMTAQTICRKDPIKFSCVLNEYVEAVRGLACEILELLGEGLELGNGRAFSRLIRDCKSDSLLRLNNYPLSQSSSKQEGMIGFGEHTDPQILTLLRSNVEGLQILSPPTTSSDKGSWVMVPPDPDTFCVHVGDVLQAMTNGRLVSVRHRAMVNPYSSRMSISYFGAPPPNTSIFPLTQFITPQNPRRYKPFTWGEYKKAMYSLRLGHNRLDHFRHEEQREAVNIG